MLNKKRNITLYALFGLSILVTIVEFLSNLKGNELSLLAQSSWAFVFFFLTFLWVYYDADRDDFEKPFDFGFFIYLFWPFVLPWYFITTRGSEGVLILLGLIFLWQSPWLAGLVAYVYFT